MRLTFTVAPLAFGIDKFFNVMVHWPKYLAPWINDIAPGTAQQFMYFVGRHGDPGRRARRSEAALRRHVVAAWLAGSLSTCSATPASTTSHCVTSA